MCNKKQSSRQKKVTLLKMQDIKTSCKTELVPEQTVRKCKSCQTLELKLVCNNPDFYVFECSDLKVVTGDLIIDLLKNP